MTSKEKEFQCNRAAATLQRMRDRVGLTAFGDHIAQMLFWSWFITITFRDTRPNSDLRLKPFPAFRRRAIERLQGFLQRLEIEADQPIGWFFVEGFGELEGRFHLHGLIAGTEHLNRTQWRNSAFRQFGLTTISQYRPGAGADDYVGKHVMEDGDLYYGGKLIDQKLVGAAKVVPVPVGKVVVARSADVPTRLFRQTLGRGRKR